MTEPKLQRKAMEEAVSNCSLKENAMQELASKE